MTGLAPWLHAPLRRATDALAAGRLGHALLVCGPEHIGKRAFADTLSRALLCRERVDGLACGHCRDCTLLAADTHPDVRVVALAENDKTGAMRREIVVEQVRDLGAWFALTAQRGGAQVAIIDPASAMNANAANALLKTLEEPLPGRHLLLTSATPMRLPATIRSRCQRIVLQPPANDIALDWLRARGHDEALARSALLAANGHPGLAAHWIETGLMGLRASVRDDLAAIAAGRAQPLDVARAWVADENARQRLLFAAEWSADLQSTSLGLAHRSGWTSASAADPQALAAWFDAANRTRAWLDTPIRADLAIAGLLRDWRRAVAA
ncbi:MAG: DNA polymerase III subunit delta' [Proteobacteria bacterium]|nr:DNA polymerase III subunit delta' [Pseudomonadota bacterium]